MIINGKHVSRKKREKLILKWIERLIDFQTWFKPLPSELIEDNDYGSYYDNFVDGNGW